MGKNISCDDGPIDTVFIDPDVAGYGVSFRTISLNTLSLLLHFMQNSNYLKRFSLHSL